MHRTFYDFIVQEGQTLKINIGYHHAFLVQASFKAMITGLRFNIGDIGSSYVRPAALALQLGPKLEYALRFLVSHVQHGSTHPEVFLDKMKEFFRSTFLFWLEVFSIRTNLPEACSVLKLLKETFTTGSDLHSFISDVESFVTTFKDPISQNPTHIYLSALPRAPVSLSRHHLPHYPQTIRVKPYFAWNNPTVVVIRKAILSPDDGYMIVCLKRGQTVWIFKFDTSQGDEGSRDCWKLESDKKKDVEVSLNCLTFTTTGKVVGARFANNTVHLLTVFPTSDTTLDMTLDPGGHTALVRSIALSPDNTWIATGSIDRTICLWDCSTRQLVKKFGNCTNEVSAVSFSPDGQLLASDGSENRILFWNVNSGERNGDFECIGPPMSIAFSPNARYLAAGLQGGTIQLINLETRLTVATLVGHIGDVHSIAFFKDCRRIMSASSDGTIRVSNIGSCLEGQVVDTDTWRMRDGWVISSQGDQLFWTRQPFKHPRNTLIIARECLDIDFSNFVHGKDWKKCREPKETLTEPCLPQNDSHTQATGPTTRAKYLAVADRQPPSERSIKSRSSMANLKTESAIPKLPRRLSVDSRG